MTRPISDADRVTVRFGVSNAAGRQRAAGAAQGFDHDRLAERSLHRIGDDARQRVGRTARRKTDYHRHRMRRIRFRRRQSSACQNRDQRASDRFIARAGMAYPRSALDDDTCR
jgi:hypothetical protein